METLISVLTPTYNRAQLLQRLFDSLRAQTNFNFEWIVVDDGSTDDTKVMIDGFKKRKSKFSIEYCYQKNGGKHRALNFGVRKAKGKFCIIVDSDDFLDKKAVEAINTWIKDLPDDFAGVAGLKAYENGQVVGGEGAKNYVDATNLERRKYNLLGDKAEIYRTAILKKYPFPTFKGEKFLTEAVVWNRIAEDGYKIRWFSQTIYYCEYLRDGLTKNIRSRHKQSPKGYAVYIKQMIHHEPLFIKKAILAGLYNRDVYNYNNIAATAHMLNVSASLVLIGTIIRRVVLK